MARFRNNYECPCGETWSDESDCTNNDRCPSCNKEIEPTDSDDMEEEFDAENIVLRVSARQRDALLCGLRNLQRTCGADKLHSLCDYDRLPFELRDILTGGDEHSPAEAHEIDDLCEAINIGPAKEPEPAKHLLVMWGDVEPQLIGPFDTDEARLEAARKHRREQSDEDGLYMLDAVGPVSVWPFTGGDLDASDEGED